VPLLPERNIAAKLVLTPPRAAAGMIAAPAHIRNAPAPWPREWIASLKIDNSLPNVAIGSSLSVSVSNLIAINEPGMNSETRFHRRKTQVLVALVVVTNVLGNAFLSRGMHQVGRIVSFSPVDYLRAFANPFAIAGILILIVWILSDLALLSRADLSFVLPVTASAYVLVALVGHFVLHDHISWQRWIGILLITGGVVLAEETPERTTNGGRGRLL
jgi:drug/metabolite transporter (DMT)-like permease